MSEDTLTAPALNLGIFEKAAELIRDKGFWDGTDNGTQCWTPAQGYCIGLAIIEQRHADGYDRDAAIDHLAAQLGYTRASFSGFGFSPQGFVFKKNDEFKDRREEGKAWALDVLDKLARGESL